MFFRQPLTDSLPTVNSRFPAVAFFALCFEGRSVMLDIGVVYVLVGRKDEAVLRQSIALLKEFRPALPVTIYSDVPITWQREWENVAYQPYERIKYEIREEHRNSDLLRLIALRDSPHEVTAYLDNDVFVVSEIFFEGFEIARNFGLTVVENPRTFIQTELDISLDVTAHDREFLRDTPTYMMAYNGGLTFYHRRSEAWLDALIEEQREHPSRGPMGIYRTVWKTKTAPYALPVNWLVCRKHAGIDNPITLHVGHENIMRWWRRDFRRKKSWKDKLLRR